MADAIRRCLHELMAADPRVRVFGEDVADAPPEHRVRARRQGRGVRHHAGSADARFGDDRCFNTPLAEANIVGRAIGQAVRGLRPIVEIQFFDYVWSATQQLKTEAATLRWRSNGNFSAPMVLRVPIGGYLTGGAIWHSQSRRVDLRPHPRVAVAMPSRAADAVGLLRAAMRCEDPVLFLEHKHLYRQPYARDPYPAEGWLVPFGRGAVSPRRRRRHDRDVGRDGPEARSTPRTRVAADGGPSVEVIDLRTLVPWDRQIVADSVARTGRLVVAHEDIRTAGFGAEVVGRGWPTCASTISSRRSAGSPHSTPTSGTRRCSRT